MKLDIEGHEIEAIKGAEQLRAHNRIFLQVEVWSHRVDTIYALMECECLHSLAKTRIPPNYQVRLIALDNDENQTGRKSFAARYVVESRRGLSTIRNRALDEAKNENAAYLAFCDDDMIYDDNWLCGLADEMQETGADAISGYVEYIFPNGKVPFWARPLKTQKDDSA